MPSAVTHLEAETDSVESGTKIRVANNTARANEGNGKGSNGDIGVHSLGEGQPNQFALLSHHH